MAFRPDSSRVSDKIYPSEIAAQRPMLAARVDCEAGDDGEMPDHSEFETEFSASRTIRGDRSENQVERMNEALNAERGIARGRR